MYRDKFSKSSCNLFCSKLIERTSKSGKKKKERSRISQVLRFLEISLNFKGAPYKGKITRCVVVTSGVIKAGWNNELRCMTSSRRGNETARCCTDGKNRSVYSLFRDRGRGCVLKMAQNRHAARAQRTRRDSIMMENSCITFLLRFLLVDAYSRMYTRPLGHPSSPKE